MDNYGRIYKTRAEDRAKKKPRVRPPPLKFSSDSDEIDFLPTHLMQNRSLHSSIVQNSPGRAQTPQHHNNSLAHQATGMDMDYERCVSCKKPFGYEEVMVCSYCSENFCCSCAKVPPIVATVQFQVPNLRWYCPPCDKHQATVIKNFKEGVVSYQSARPTTSTPNPSAGRKEPQAQNDTPQTGEIKKILSEFSNRMDSHELLIGELRDLLREKWQNQTPLGPTVQKNNPAPQQTLASVQASRPAPQQTQVNGQASKPARQNTSVKSTRTVSFANALQTNVSQSQQLAPTGNSIATEKQQHPASSSVDPSGTRRRRLVLTPAAANTEIEEIEKRKNNIVIHNLPEQEAENKQEADMEEINFMLSEGMLLTNILAESTKRLGAPRTDGKPRSLLVILNTERTKVLKKARAIQEWELWKEVYVDPDRTPKERREHANLRKELQTRKRNGETDLIIRDGTIVHRRSVPMEVQMEDLTAPAHSAQSESPAQAQDNAAQENQEEQSTNETLISQAQSNEDTPQGTQSVSDNTLGEIEVPEVMRHADEDDEYHDPNHTCTID